MKSVAPCLFIALGWGLLLVACDSHDHEHTEGTSTGMEEGLDTLTEDGSADSTTGSGEEAETEPLSTGLDGNYENAAFGNRLKIEGVSWEEGSIDMTSEYAYEATHTLVAEIEPGTYVYESGFEPGTFDVIAVTGKNDAGGFYACTAAFGLESMDEAMKADLSATDKTNPEGPASCGGAFAFTLWSAVADGE